MNDKQEAMTDKARLAALIQARKFKAYLATGFYGTARTTAEIESATKRLQKLIAQYGFTDEELTGENPRLRNVDAFRLPFYRDSKLKGYDSIAIHFLCKVYLPSVSMVEITPRGRRYFLIVTTKAHGKSFRFWYNFLRRFIPTTLPEFEQKLKLAAEAQSQTWTYQSGMVITLFGQAPPPIPTKGSPEWSQRECGWVYGMCMNLAGRLHTEGRPPTDGRSVVVSDQSAVDDILEFMREHLPEAYHQVKKKEERTATPMPASDIPIPSAPTQTKDEPTIAKKRGSLLPEDISLGVGYLNAIPLAVLRKWSKPRKTKEPGKIVKALTPPATRITTRTTRRPR